MGEEYGEEAPFQFFTDHIDQEIAIATRDGRRREFASFAHFAGEEVPDPQDPATFERSTLTRRGDDSLRDLYTRLLAARRRLPRGPVDHIDYDDAARWLRVRRGSSTMIMNFSEAEQTLAADARELVLATHDAVDLRSDGAVALPPLSGALVEGPA
jgi:maltooligosyltrehalose trehalohydrolase